MSSPSSTPESEVPTMISDVLFLTARLGMTLALFAFVSHTWDEATASWSACQAETAEAAAAPQDLVQSLQRLRQMLPFVPAALKQSDDGQPVSATCSHA
jgi:hypothetical protein